MILKSNQYFEMQDSQRVDTRFESPTNSEPDFSPSVQQQHTALKAVGNAAKYANDCGKNIWEFSVEISFFASLGVSNSLLRWLMCKRLFEHRLEVSSKPGNPRIFREAKGLNFSPSSCFSITPCGMEWLDQLNRKINTMNLNFTQNDTSNNASIVPIDSAIKGQVNTGTMPEWCSDTRTLTIDGKVVKHFKWPAPNQEKLIAAFQELGWPSRMDDPLAQDDVDPKRRLHDTIKCLNKNQKNSLIKFRGDGTGKGVLWHFIPDGWKKPTS